MVGDAALGAVDHVRIRLRGHQGGELLLAGRIHEEAVNVGQRVVSGGSFCFPVRRQLFAGFQNLFDQDVRTVCELAQPGQVALGISQPVRVVDPQPVHESFIKPALDFHMGFVEDPGLLHPDAGEGVHAEEAAVVQLVVRPPPVHQFVVLAGVDVHGRIAVGRRSRRHRVSVVVVVQLVVDQLQLLQFVVAVAQDGQAQFSACRIPVDVESVGITRAAPFQQKRPPPGVARGSGDTHVVGHDVRQHAHAGGVSGIGECFQPLGAAAGRIHRCRVNHVVAVVRTRLSGQDR